MLPIRKIYSIILSLLFFSGSIFAQGVSTKGKEFWFGFMQNYKDTNATRTLIVQISSDAFTNGVLEVPGKGFLQGFTVLPNNITTIIIPDSIAHIITSEQVEQRAVHIRTNDSVSVFAGNVLQYTTDASVILPVNALGKEYYVMAYSGYCSEFLVVATADNTQVEITPKTRTFTGQLPGVPFTVTLQKGEAYQVKADSLGAINSVFDMTGSHIRTLNSCQPVAVFGGSACSNVPQNINACDHLYDQMFPVRSVGKNYCTVPLKSRNGDNFRIMAVQPNTTYQLDGNTPAVLSNPGDFYEYYSTGPGYITADKPVMVSQYSRGALSDNVLNGDPFMVMLAPEEQMLNNITFSTMPSTNVNHYLNIITANTNAASIRLNGNPVSGFNIVPFRPDFSYAQVDLTFGTNTAEYYTLTADSGFIAYVYGFGPFDSYGYAAGCDVKNLNLEILIANDTMLAPDTYCATDSILFQSFIQFPPQSYLWDFGDGTVSSLKDPHHLYPDTGTYTVKLFAFYTDVCMTDSLVKVIRLIRPVVTVTGDTLICTGDSTVLTAAGGTLYQWSTGDTTASLAVKPVSTTTYTVMAIIDGCASEPYPVTVQVIPPLNGDAGADTSVCKGDTLLLQASGGLFYYWWPAEGLSDTLAAGPKAYPDQTTLYYVAISDSNCTMIDSILVTVSNPLSAPAVFCDSTTLNSVLFTWNAVAGAAGYEVSTDQGLTWIAPNSGNSNTDTTHRVSGLNPGEMVSLLVKALSPLPCGASPYTQATCTARPCPQVKISIIADEKLIQPGQEIAIKAEVTGGIGPFIFQWVPDIGPGPGPFVISPESEEKYTVTLRDSGAEQCPVVSDSILIRIKDGIYLYVPNAFSPNNDGINDLFKANGFGIADYRLSVFNRWGELLYTTAQLENGWDGLFNNRECPNGIYVYMVRFTGTDGEQHLYPGTVMLNR